MIYGVWTCTTHIPDLWPVNSHSQVSIKYLSVYLKYIVLLGIGNLDNYNTHTTCNHVGLHANDMNPCNYRGLENTGQTLKYT